MQEILKLVEKAIIEISDSVGDKRKIRELTETSTFPKVAAYDFEDKEQEAYNYASDELIRCLRNLNQARKNLTNLGIKVNEEKVQTQRQEVRQQLGRTVSGVSGTKITS